MSTLRGAVHNTCFFHKKIKTSKTNNGDTMNKQDNKKILLSHKGKFTIKFVVSILLNVLLLVIPIYYSKLIDALSILDLNKAYAFLIIFASLTKFYFFF